jgi:hypothetical protein
MVRYHTTTMIIYLGWFTGSHISNMQSVLFNTCSSGQNDTTLNRQGYLEPLISTSLSPIFSFDDNPISPSWPIRSQINPSVTFLQSKPFLNHHYVKRGPTCKWDLHLTYIVVLSFKHSSANILQLQKKVQG